MLRRVLSLSRHLLVVPVVGSLLLTIGVVLVGVGLIVDRGLHFLQNRDFSAKAAKAMSVTVVQTLDFFLVGALTYITAVGLYKLFLSTGDEQLLRRIKIEKLKDLEDKIIGVVVAALSVAFLGSVVEASDMRDVFYGGTGTALVIGALCVFIRLGSSPDVAAAPESVPAREKDVVG